eukprot:c6758_g1_i1.p1 GENE.c6758_g1_i1~~c6758_g1_i1.p1  ORF type:complete len:311 (+),score=49.74 c6758_g1_i1:43-975(+)
MSAGWCTIESDPGVFTDLIEQIGTKGVEVRELWSLDDLDHIPGKLHGLIFLFKWRPEEDPRKTVNWEDVDIFFAKQVVNNACATQAILSVLMNASDLELGPILTAFKDFTWTLNPELKGLSIQNSEEIRTAHNSFSQQQSFALEDIAAKEDDDVFHFISYVPVKGRLYELDGLKAGPIDLGEITEIGWQKMASAVISERILRYTNAEIRFNLLAVVNSQLSVLTSRLEQLQSIENPSETVQAELSEVIERLAVENDIRAKWKIENLRRKHNYVPFVFHLLKILAEKNQLQPLVDRATEEAAKKAKTQARK